MLPTFFMKIYVFHDICKYNFFHQKYLPKQVMIYSYTNLFSKSHVTNMTI